MCQLINRNVLFHTIQPHSQVFSHAEMLSKRKVNVLSWSYTAIMHCWLICTAASCIPRPCNLSLQKCHLVPVSTIRWPLSWCITASVKLWWRHFLARYAAKEHLRSCVVSNRNWKERLQRLPQQVFFKLHLLSYSYFLCVLKTVSHVHLTTLTRRPHVK